MHYQKVKHTNITTIYKDSENGMYIKSNLKVKLDALGAKTKWSKLKGE